MNTTNGSERAVTKREKKEILNRIYKLWSADDNNFLRLGQLIGNVIREESTLYNIEDYPFIERLEGKYKEFKMKGILSKNGNKNPNSK